jgi:NTP pyrophosphatase (non-canonical NTP hydrolase)
MTNKIDLNRYSKFVEQVTSEASNSLSVFTGRVQELAANHIINSGAPEVNVPLLITSAMGMAAEAGEFSEVPKKLLFHGKPLTEEVLLHMKKELGDVIWYWTNACRALNLDPNDVIEENIKKLESRYPGGRFDAHYSEHRNPDDK